MKDCNQTVPAAQEGTKEFYAPLNSDELAEGNITVRNCLEHGCKPDKCLFKQFNTGYLCVAQHRE